MPLYLYDATLKYSERCCIGKILAVTFLMKASLTFGSENAVRCLSGGACDSGSGDGDGDGDGDGEDEAVTPSAVGPASTSSDRFVVAS